MDRWTEALNIIIYSLLILLVIIIAPLILLEGCLDQRDRPTPQKDYKYWLFKRLEAEDKNHKEEFHEE